MQVPFTGLFNRLSNRVFGRAVVAIKPQRREVARLRKVSYTLAFLCVLVS